MINPLAAANTPATARGTTAPNSFSSCATTRTANARDCVAGDLLDNYDLIKTVNAAAAGGLTANQVAAFTAIGLNLLDTTQNNLGTAIDDTALSIADFNNFRKRVAVAIDELDRKFEDILQVTNPTCT